MEGNCDELKILEPHLNANGYKSLEYNIPPNHCDFIVMHDDGAVLLGRSNLTERHWTGAATVLDTIEDLKSQLSSHKTDSQSTICLLSGVTDGCFVHTSSTILLSEDSGSLSLWSKSEGGEWASLWSKQLEVEEHDGAISAIQCLEPGQTYISVGEDANIKVWDISDFICKHTLRYNRSMINDVSVCVDSTSAFATAAMDGTVSLWDLNCDRSVKVLHYGNCEARCVRWLDERRLLVGEEGGRILLLDIRTDSAPLATDVLPYPLHRIRVQSSTNRIAVCGDTPVVTVLACSPGGELSRLYTSRKAHGDLARGVVWDTTQHNKLHSVAWDGALFTHTVPDA